MSAFSHIPLGRPIPDSPHAVSCSLPTMRAVRGYEERNPDVIRHVKSGYPRFVVNPFAVRLAGHLSAAPGMHGRRLWLTSSGSMAGALADRLNAAGTGAGARAEAWSHAGVNGVSHADTPETGGLAKLYLQHTGGFISSREAEDALVRLGLADAAWREASFEGDAAAEIRRHLKRAMPGTGDGDLLLANSGMNAIYAAFRAVSEVQAARGRTLWVQLGWLYLDTIALLRKFTASPGDCIHVRDVFDREGLARLFAEKGSSIAGVVAEVPTNPLMQTPDIEALAGLCRKHGARLVVDPSMSSVFSVRALPHADVVASSLTKYTASEGDVIAGLAAVNPAGSDAGALRLSIASALEPVYPRDLARLAAEIGSTEAVLGQIEENAGQVAAFLSSHPGVKEVFWALHPASSGPYLRLARTPRSTGGMISFTLRGPMEPFYDRLRIPKGPSFGMKTSLICPQMYLAHYDLVTTAAGRAELAENGIDPDLLRLSVGAEPAADIIAALEEGFGA
jgi:cystathionine gamma-synthase